MPAMCNSIGRWHCILQNEGLINLLLQLGTPCCHCSADGNKTQSKVTLRDIKIPLCGNFRILLLNPLQMLAQPVCITLWYRQNVIVFRVLAWNLQAYWDNAIKFSLFIYLLVDKSLNVTYNIYTNIRKKHKLFIYLLFIYYLFCQGCVFLTSQLLLVPEASRRAEPCLSLVLPGSLFHSHLPLCDAGSFAGSWVVSTRSERRLVLLLVP